MKSTVTDQSFDAENTALQLAEKDLLLSQMSKIIDEKNLVIESKTDALDKTSQVISKQKQRIDQLLEALRLQRGRSSEKNSNQGELFDEAELCCEPEGDDSDDERDLPEKPTPPKAKKKGRKGLSPSLPRDQVFINLTNEEKEGAISTFHTLVKEELDITPAKVRVIEYMQEKAVFPATTERNSTIKAATMPQHPLGKTIASVGLLAYTIISKFFDGLPLYRLETILKRYGGDISHTSMANWAIKLSLEKQPLINLLREHQNAYDYMHIDETRIQVLKEPGFSPHSQKWMWLTRGGPPDKPIILFDYQTTREKTVPLHLFEDFHGYLQGDGYSGYDEICTKNSLISLGCWDHARRKFVNAEKAAGKSRVKGSNRTPKYAVALSKIRKLYVIEDRIKDLSVIEKYCNRQEYSKPVVKMGV